MYQKRFQVFNNENSITLNNETLFDDFQNILKNVFTITKNRNVENSQLISQNARKNNNSQKIDKFNFKIIDVRESQNQIVNIVKVFFKFFIDILRKRLNLNKFSFRRILKIQKLHFLSKSKRSYIFEYYLKKTTCVSIRKSYSSIIF